MGFVRALASLVILVLAGSVSAEEAKNKVALVIGNSAYRQSSLASPAKDARLMAETLKAAGFEVFDFYDVGQRKMKPDPQPRQTRGARNRVFGVCRRDHQARSREDSFGASDFYRLVHFARKAEIVRGDDETVQVGSPLRSRRNDMNSTPSLSLRPSI